jgi:hypothetical protein
MSDWYKVTPDALEPFQQIPTEVHGSQYEEDLLFLPPALPDNLHRDQWVIITTTPFLQRGCQVYCSFLTKDTVKLQIWRPKDLPAPSC